MKGKHHKSPWWRLGALRRCLGRYEASPPPGHLSEMVDGSGWAHLVTREAYEQGLRDHTGHYQVLCGLQILAASMAAPPDHFCVLCHEQCGQSGGDSSPSAGSYENARDRERMLSCPGRCGVSS
jgi:hypothetical protein